MFKSLVISTLLFALYGCATPGPQQSDTATLLSFADLAAEITVRHEAAETEVVETDVPESIAAVQKDSSQDTTD